MLTCSQFDSILLKSGHALVGSQPERVLFAREEGVRLFSICIEVLIKIKIRFLSKSGHALVGSKPESAICKQQRGLTHSAAVAGKHLCRKKNLREKFSNQIFFGQGAKIKRRKS